MKLIFEQAIASVNSAYPSIYTKEDVVKLINDLWAGVEAADLDRPAFDLETLKDFKQSLLENVKNIDFEDCVGLELSYDNRIDIEIDTRTVLSEIEQCFDVAVDEVFSEQTTTNQ